MDPNTRWNLLFDLDGTLVRRDFHTLDLRYLVRAIPRVASIIKPWRLHRALLDAAKAMKDNDSHHSNFERCVDTLSKYSTRPKEQVNRVIREAIEQDFAALERSFKPFPGARETLLQARAKGHRLIVATNPVFPLSGVLTRLKHANLGDIPFDYIANAEVMTRAKPRVDYYAELIVRLELDPQQTMMIGNDPIKDLPAKEIGLTTFLLDDPIEPLSDVAKQDPRLDYYGNYESFRKRFLS